LDTITVDTVFKFNLTTPRFEVLAIYLVILEDALQEKSVEPAGEERMNELTGGNRS
jgi:hypothetical protein